MADKTIDSELIYLFPNQWPAGTKTVRSAPIGGFTGSTHHNVKTPVYNIGEKIEVYCNGTVGKAGYSELTYLKVGTQNADVAIAAKTLCVGDSATTWYEVTNDPDSCVKNRGVPVAVALSAMTNGCYGWFWTGGVCPEQYVPGLGGNYPTDSTVAAGPICVGDLTADAIGFSAPIDHDTDTDTASGASTTPAKNTVPADWACGMAIAADAA